MKAWALSTIAEVVCSVGRGCKATQSSPQKPCAQDTGADLREDGSGKVAPAGRAPCLVAGIGPRVQVPLAKTAAHKASCCRQLCGDGRLR